MLTPAMQQYYDIKGEYPDSIIFFRMGDFYEMFGDDAHIAHKILGINITSRNKNAQNPEALAGFPYHAKDKYLPLLVNAGYKVAIVEQVSDPQLKGIVKREVVRVITPATLNLEGDMYDTYDQNILMSISKNQKGLFGLSLLDLLSGKWQTCEFQNFETLQKELFRLNPKEVILEKNLFSDEQIKETLQKKYSLNIYYYELKKDAKIFLSEHFGIKDFTGFGLEIYPEAIRASGLLLDYLETNQKQNLKQFKRISLYVTSQYLEIDSSTIRNLDLLYNFSTGSEIAGTLFGVLNHTKTPMGKRFLKENILHPLKNEEQIQKRFSFVEELLKDTILLDKLREHLSYISDIDAILNRLALERISPRDLLNLKRSLEAIVSMESIIQSHGNQKILSILQS